jgi:hypothetical protein
MPIAFLALGALLVGLAPLLSSEYRRAFFANPRSLLSAKVLARVIGLGGLGYVAVASLVAGVLLLVAGVVLLVLLLWIPISN